MPSPAQPDPVADTLAVPIAVVLERWVYPGFQLRLFPDECKGYFLNLTSGRPSWFVSWRSVDEDPSLVEVTAASVSYIEADRRMSAEERVESVALAPELCEWLQDFTNRHFQPEGKRKVRAMSFLKPEERARRMADGLPPGDSGPSA
jgi:Protein of unknown function (DUF3305)